MQTAPGAGIRLVSMFLDHVFMCIILFAPIILFGVLRPGEGEEPATLNPNAQFLFLGLMIVYFLKDSFEGRSLAKRLLKLQVVRKNSREPASVGQCFVRNLFVIFWPIEVLVTLFQPQRRIGDLVAGTRVVFFDPNAVPEEQGLLGDLLP